MKRLPIWQLKPRQYVGIGLVFALVIVTGVLVINRVMQPAASRDDKLAVTASFYPLYDIAQRVGGKQVDVTNVTPAGAEPHDYEPSPQQLATASKARVFIYNGGTMEPWTDKFTHDYTGVAVKASDRIDVLHGEPHEDEDEDHAHEGGANGHDDQPATDPHFWLDPVLAKQIVSNVRDGLSKADPAHSQQYAERAAAYAAQLDQLNEAYAKGLQDCQTRTLITSHSAFSYLAKRYNLDVVAISGLSPDEEPSAAKLAELSQLVRDKNIKYVFFESLSTPDFANTIARETGAQTKVFDPIEGLNQDDQAKGKNYLSVQRDNLANLRAALVCR